MHDRRADLALAPLGASTMERAAWQAADRCTVKCGDYLAHRSEHRRHLGLWRCFACYPIGDRP